MTDVAGAVNLEARRASSVMTPEATERRRLARRPATARDVRNLHEAACFSRAYPENAHPLAPATHDRTG